MIYLKRSNAAVKKSRSKTIAISILLVFLFGLHFFFPKFYPSIFYPITSLVWKIEKSTVDWFSHMGGIVRSKYSLVEENRRLEMEIQTNKTSLLLLDILKNENLDLKLILGRKSSEKMVLGVILASPPTSPYDTAIIDVGSDDGIVVGDKVFADGDVLIGEIAEVYGNQSKIFFLSTPGKKTMVSFINSKIKTEAIGRGGGNFRANIPAGAGVIAGDIVVSADIDPKNMGIVESVDTDSADSFSSILFRMPINIYSLHFVEIQTSQ
jgi:cell shape-determining protein MreC